MSLRRALAALPDDRATVAATREVLNFFETHPSELVDEARVVRATRIAPDRAQTILRTLVNAFVIDCGGSDGQEYSYTPDALLALEMKRYLQSYSRSGTSLQKSTDRFRNRYGGGS